MTVEVNGWPSWITLSSHLVASPRVEVERVVQCCSTLPGPLDQNTQKQMISKFRACVNSISISTPLLLVNGIERDGTISDEMWLWVREEEDAVAVTPRTRGSKKKPSSVEEFAASSVSSSIVEKAIEEGSNAPQAAASEEALAEAPQAAASEEAPAAASPEWLRAPLPGLPPTNPVTHIFHEERPVVTLVGVIPPVLLRGLAKDNVRILETTTDPPTPISTFLSPAGDVCVGAWKIDMDEDYFCDGQRAYKTMGQTSFPPPKLKFIRRKRWRRY